MTNIIYEKFRYFVLCSSAAHMMSHLEFPTMISELGCSCEILVLNHVYWVLEKLLTSKSLTQKQERATTVAALVALEMTTLLPSVYKKASCSDSHKGDACRQATCSDGCKGDTGR